MIQNAPTTEPFMRDRQNSSIWERWFTFLVHAVNTLAVAGTTAQRPNPAPYVGFVFFDTTVSRPVWAKTLTQYVYSDGMNA